MSENRSAAADGAVLQIVSGTNSGSEYKVSDGEIIIGRQASCGIVISDIAISRKHASVSFEDGKYILRDLGSGNGTTLDGKPVSMDGVQLRDGQTFKLGDTEIFFSTSGARKGAMVKGRTSSREVARRSASNPEIPVRRRRRSTDAVDENDELEIVDGDSSRRGSRRRRGREEPVKKSSKAVLVLVVVLIVGLVSVFTKILYDKNQIAQKQRDVLAQIQEQEDAIKNSVSDAIGKGRDASRKGEFKAALAAFEEAEKIASENEIELPKDAKRNIEYAKKEIANQELVNQSRELAQAGKLSEAMQLVGKIPENSFFYGRISDLKVDFTQYFPPFLEKARAFLKEKKFDEAQAALEEIFVVDSRDPEALKLQADIERAAELAKRPVRKKPVAVVERVDPSLPALELFYKGQMEAALETAKACNEPECVKVAAKIAAFADAFVNVDLDTEKAFNALMEVPGAKKSTFYKAIASKIATTVAKEGVREMGSQNYAAAFKAFQRVLSLDPMNPVARKHMTTIHQSAQELFQQGYVEKGTDPESARRKFEKVLTLTANNDDLHVKAQRQLKSLMSGTSY